MSKQTLVIVMIIGVLSAGVGWLARSQISPKTPPPDHSDTAVERARWEDLESKSNAVVANVAKVRAENDRLRRTLREQRAIASRAAARPEKGLPEDPDPAGSGNNWERLSVSLAAWLQVEDSMVRDGYRQLTPSEEAQQREVMVALTAAVEKAHEISDYPIFDDQIFPNLAVALFGSFLDLNDDQATQIEERARRLVRDAAAELDPARALPVERAGGRQDLVVGLLEAARKILQEDQQSQWPLVANAITSVLGGPQRRIETGIDEWDDGRLAEFITGEWQRTFTVSEDKSLSLREYALDYERGVRELLAENGQSPDSSGPLTWEDKKAFERAMLDLQISIESQVITLLDDEQVAALPDAVPVVLIFKNGGDQSIIERNAPSF